MFFSGIPPHHPQYRQFVQKNQNLVQLQNQKMTKQVRRRNFFGSTFEFGNTAKLVRLFC